MKRTTLLQGLGGLLGAFALCVAVGSTWRLDHPALFASSPAPIPTADELNGALLNTQHAQREYERAKREALARCRAERGPDALVWETPEGHIVCRRRAPGGLL